MLQNILGLGRSGLQAWWLQRVSAVILTSYFIFLLAYLSLNQISFHNWQALFSLFKMQFFTLLALLSLVIHCWLGIWIVLTDYAKKFWLRSILQTTINIYLFGCFVAGVTILYIHKF